MSRRERHYLSRRNVIKGLGTGILATSLAGCTGGDGGDGSGNGDGDGDGDGGGGSTGTPSPLELVIANPTSLSGPFAPYGEAERDGGQLAVQHLESDLNVELDLVTADTEVNPSTAVERTERMVVEDGAHVAYGGVSSAVGLAIGNWATDNQVPFAAHGTSNDITGSQCSEYLFSTYMSNSMQVRPIAPRMAEMEDEWFILYSDYTWGQTANETFTQHLQDEGATIVGREAVPFPSKDYTQYLNTAADSDATGLALLVAGLDQRTSTAQVLDLGLHEDFTIVLHQNEDAGFHGISKEQASIVDLSSQGWSPGLDVAEDWKLEVTEISDHDPQVRHVIGYQSVDQLVRSADRAGTTNGSEIIEELNGHTVENDRVLQLHGDPDRMYWREGDHQLMQPVYATRGLPVDDMTDDPYRVWFEVIDSLSGDEASPEPSPECEFGS